MRLRETIPTQVKLIKQYFTEVIKFININLTEMTDTLVAGLSSLHSSTSSDEGNNTVVNNSGGVTGIAQDGDFGTLV